MYNKKRFVNKDNKCKKYSVQNCKIRKYIFCTKLEHNKLCNINNLSTNVKNKLYTLKNVAL